LLLIYRLENQFLSIVQRIIKMYKQKQKEYIFMFFYFTLFMV